MRNNSHNAVTTFCAQRLCDFDSFRRIPRKVDEQGFTRLELAALLVAVALLATLALPVLANPKLRSQRLVCFNNLGRIGQAIEMWGTEHGRLYPWQIPYTAEGGTMNHPLRANTWFQFLAVSNELVTPKYLACPSDTARVVATDFSFSPFGGFLHVNYRNRAISYVLGHPFLQEGRGILSGDRNIEGGSFSASCNYFGPPILNFPTPSNASWGTNIHVTTGNLLFNDGSVMQSDNASLRASLNNTNFDNYSIHLLPNQ